jgi:hypothetical protein
MWWWKEQKIAVQEKRSHISNQMSRVQLFQGTTTVVYILNMCDCTLQDAVTSNCVQY